MRAATEAAPTREAVHSEATDPLGEATAVAVSILAGAVSKAGYRGYYGGGPSFYFGYGAPYYYNPGYYDPASCGYYDAYGYWHAYPGCVAPYSYGPY